MNPLTVFYSWQSDTDARTNRAFIRDALKSAIADLDLMDAERPEIDQDTSGVPGAPVISETIFNKIRAASVFVADVTLTGKTSNGKHLCNSNVALELGYALGVLGDYVLLNVMNGHYGPPDALPFDMAHRRWPLQYTLAPDASNNDRQVAKSTLAAQLTPILKSYLAVVANRRIEAAAADLKNKADVRADFVKYGTGRYMFKVSNWGPAAARNVRVEFPDGNPGVLVDKVFPMELMEHHQPVEVAAVVSMETLGKHRVRLVWDDDSDLDREKMVYATI